MQQGLQKSIFCQLQGMYCVVRQPYHELQQGSVAIVNKVELDNTTVLRTTIGFCQQPGVANYDKKA